MPTRDAQPGVETPALIFAWRRPGGVRRRLILCLAVAVFGHFFLFYLFKVVMPAYRRTAPPPRSMTFLPATLSDAGRLMRNVGDRYPGLNPYGPLDNPDTGALRALVKDYEPSWKGHVAALKPMPSGDFPPSLLPYGGVVLPPLEPVEESASPRVSPPLAAFPANADSLFTEAPAPPSIPVLGVHSGLGERRMLNPVNWPTGLFNDKWPESGRASFSLKIDPEGTVSACLPWSLPAGLQPETLERLLSALQALRFSSAATETVQWGIVEVQW